MNSIDFIEIEFLGVSVIFRSSHPALLETLRQAYGKGRRGGASETAPIEIRLDVGLVAEGEEDIRVDGARLTLRGDGVAGEADAAVGAAKAMIAARLVGDPTALAARLLDTLMLWLLTRADRTPLHAAGVMMGDTALALAGPSGSGKSTLALAAMARGFPILSDDTLYIQLRPRLKAWGLARPLHVFPKDAPRFTQGLRLRGGKLKAVAPMTLAAPEPAEKVVVVLLERGERLALTRLDAGTVAAGLCRLDPGFDLLAKETAEIAAVLAAAGGWRLTLSDDPGAAIDFLRARLPLDDGV